MTETPQPTAGSLSAKVIRRCPSHRNCPLTCKQRKVEDLGEIAHFDIQHDVPDDSLLDRLKEGLTRWLR